MIAIAICKGGTEMGTRHQLRTLLWFFSDLLRQPRGVAVWVFALTVVNLADVA